MNDIEFEDVEMLAPFITQRQLPVSYWRTGQSTRDFTRAISLPLAAAMLEKPTTLVCLAS